MPGFINFRVLRFVGVYADNSRNNRDGMVNKLFVASTTRSKMSPKRRLGPE